ncbi:MAG: OmpA family protein, partial [Myxococcales bacterium]|nr:OmpA family protein [Myxococcales bacterium]
MVLRSLLLALVAVTASGCVMSSTHEALLKKHEAKIEEARSLTAALETANARITELEQERDALKSQIDQLQAEKARQLKDNSQLEASIQQMQQALSELEQRKREAEARIAEFRELLARFKPLMDSGKLQVKLVDGRMVVVLATDVLFASGKAELSEEGQAAIAEVAGLLASLEGKRFQVEGHTDNVPIKTRQYPSNWELAAARSLTVVKAMVEAGLAPERVSGAAFGEFKPAAANDTDENKAKNRRIEIV